MSGLTRGMQLPIRSGNCFAINIWPLRGECLVLEYFFKNKTNSVDGSVCAFVRDLFGKNFQRTRRAGSSVEKHSFSRFYNPPVEYVSNNNIFVYNSYK